MIFGMLAMGGRGLQMHVFLLGVAFVAARFGRGPGIAASILSVLAFDYFFVKPTFKLTAEDQFRINTLHEMVISKLSKRQISLKNVDSQEPDISPLGHARQLIKIKQGIEQAAAKQITAFNPPEYRMSSTRSRSNSL